MELNASIATRVERLMPELRSDLERLTEGHDLIVELLRAAGVRKLAKLELPDTSPVVIGEIAAPNGAPSVLLYAHYDVVPRGLADDKSNVIVHLGALRAYGGAPPVGIKILFEGPEKYGSPFDYDPRRNPELFRADAMVITDLGNLRPGVPRLTVAFRGDSKMIVEVRTLEGPKHNGEFDPHAPNERVLLDELEQSVIAEAEFLRDFAARKKQLQ